MPLEKGSLPKAYLRLDPNIDQTHPDNLEAFVRLLCAANRQPNRGLFKSRPVLETLMGKPAVKRFYARGDVVDESDGHVRVPGWRHWQEGDLNVATRMRNLRARRNGEGHADVSPAVTPPSPDRDSSVTAGVTKSSPASNASGSKAARRQTSSDDERVSLLPDSQEPRAREAPTTDDWFESSVVGDPMKEPTGKASP
jgi:hypothetical protein